MSFVDKAMLHDMVSPDNRKGPAMDRDAFFAHLKHLPLTKEDIEKFIAAIAEGPPISGLDDSADGACVTALADRLVEVITMPASKAFVRLLLGLGFHISGTKHGLAFALAMKKIQEPKSVG